MYGVRERMLLRQLVEGEGRTQSAAARELGIHRRTLQRWVAAGLLDTELDVINVRHGPRPPVPTRLEAAKPLIPARLAEFPLLTAQRRFVECRAAGLDFSVQPSVKCKNSRACTRWASSNARRSSSCSDHGAWARRI